MADVIKWPDVTLPSYGTTEDVEDTSIRSTFEDGTIQARRKYTKSRILSKQTLQAIKKKLRKEL